MFFYNQKVKSKCGFTLAEVLITLVIIGIISSMTIPTIMANTRKTEIETKLKQMYSIMNNALTKAVAENGPANSWEEMIISKQDKSQTIFDTYLRKHLNIAKEEQTTLREFGYKNIKRTGGKTWDLDSDRNIVVLNNGITIIDMVNGSIYINYDTGETTGLSSASYLFDINGLKGPNYWGKDIFILQLRFADINPHFEMQSLRKAKKEPIGNPGGYWTTEFTQHQRSTLIEGCRDKGGETCGALIQSSGWKIPKDYPLNI